MKYMLLIYSNPAMDPAYGSPAFEKMMAGFYAASERMMADGVMRGGDELQGIETASSLRIRGGKVETMDGPFAEVREHLGGYFLIDVPDLDSALKYAALLPVAHWGTIEVRPLVERGNLDA